MAAMLVARGAPTTLQAADLFWRAAFAGAAALAGAHARRLSWLLAACLVLVSAAGTAAVILAALALILAVASLVIGRHQLLGAAVGAIVAQAAFRLGWPDIPLASAAVGALVLAALVISAVRVQRPAVRHRWVVGLSAATGVGALIALTFTLSALEARSSADSAVKQADNGLSAATNGDTSAASAELQRAAAAFGRAHRLVAAWWARPAGVIPLLAPQAEALDRLTSDGARLASAAADAADAAAPDALRPTGGVINVARLQAAQGPVDLAVDTLDSVAATLGILRSPWLLPPINDLVSRLQIRLRSASTQAREIQQVVQIAPAMLGADGVRHYFLAVLDPSELRGAGGLVVDYGVLTTDGGRLSLTHFGDITDLNVPEFASTRQLAGPADYLARYRSLNDPVTNIQDVTDSPDFPTVGQVITELYPQSGGEPIDGVVSVDPDALADVLQLTGPITVAGWPVPITAANAATILLHDEYSITSPDGERFGFLATMIRTVVDDLTSQELPPATTIIDALRPAVTGKHLMIYSDHPDEEQALGSLGIGGALPPLADDFLAVVGQNTSSSKIDWYLRRSIAYHASFDPGTGLVSSRVDVQLLNTAPAEGQPVYVLGGAMAGGPGYNSMYLSVYSPLLLVSALLNGQPVVLSRQQELGRNVYATPMAIPPGQTYDLQLNLRGQLSTDTYRLDVSEQPLPFADELTTQLDVPGGWTLTSDGFASGATPLVANRTLTARFGRRADGNGPAHLPGTTRLGQILAATLALAIGLALLGRARDGATRGATRRAETPKLEFRG